MFFRLCHCHWGRTGVFAAFGSVIWVSVSTRSCVGGWLARKPRACEIAVSRPCFAVIFSRKLARPVASTFAFSNISTAKVSASRSMSLE